MASVSGVVNTTDYNGRYLSFSWALTSQDASANKSFITWSLRGAGSSASQYYESGDFLVKIDGETIFESSARIRLYNGTIVSSGNITLTHYAQGNRDFVVTITAAIFEQSSNVDGAGFFTLPNISRYASLISVDNFTDESNPTAAFINPTGGEISLEIRAAGVVAASRSITGSPSPYVLSLTEAERETLRALSPENNKLAVSYVLITLSGGVSIHEDTMSAEMEIINADPLLSGVLFWDANTDTTAITQNERQLIQTKSLLTVKIGSMSAIKGSELSRVEITANNETITQSISGQSLSDFIMLYGAVNSATNCELLISVIDTRGNKTTQKINLVMYEWSEPSASITCSRSSINGSLVTVDIAARYSSIAGKNSITKRLRYKENGSETWSSYLTITGSSVSLSLSGASRWLFEIELADLLSSVTYYDTIDEETPILFIDKTLRSFGVACFPKNEHSLEVLGVDIMKALFFEDGETLTIGGSISASGYICENSGEIVFSLALPKSAGNMTTFTLNELKINARGISGQVLGAYSASGYDVLADNSLTASAFVSDNMLTVAITNATAWSETNDTPLSIEICALELTLEN